MVLLVFYVIMNLSLEMEGMIMARERRIKLRGSSIFDKNKQIGRAHV